MPIALNLDAAYLRVSRAHEHLNELRSICASVSNSYAQEIAKQFTPKTIRTDGAWVELGTTPAQNVPPSVSIIAGEVAHNLRAALDYLVVRLSLSDAPMLVGKRKNQFPVEHSPQDFQGRRENHLRGVNDRHIRQIEQFQPFAGCDWTARLVEISDIEKHNDLVVIEQGTNLFVEPSADLQAANPVVKMHFTPTLKIRVGNGPELIPLLEILHSQVSQVLDAFKGEFIPADHN